LLRPPFKTVLKPYGNALVELAASRPEILCLSGDLTRQCEVDIFQETFPGRFIHAGMAEANMIGLAGALARQGFIPFVHTFGVFATRRPLDQIVNAIAYPNLPVKLIGFMPGLSSPGGPSHQAIEDVALMRAIPNMTVVDAADVTEIRAILPAIAELPGPVYLRLKRGEIPVLFPEPYEFSFGRTQLLRTGSDVLLVSSGMMLPTVLQAADTLSEVGVSVSVASVSVLKPFDSTAIIDAAARVRAVVTIENHSIIGGLGSAVAEALAERGSGTPLRRVGIQDTFAEGARNASYLFEKYGLSTQSVVDTAWKLINPNTSAPLARVLEAEDGEYAPV
jgi:transketolase